MCLWLDVTSWTNSNLNCIVLHLARNVHCRWRSDVWCWIERVCDREVLVTIAYFLHCRMLVRSASLSCVPATTGRQLPQTSRRGSATHTCVANNTSRRGYVQVGGEEHWRKERRREGNSVATGSRCHVGCYEQRWEGEGRSLYGLCLFPRGKNVTH